VETALKQRLVGAAVLVALAVICLPMLVQGPAPESGMSDVPLELPRAPAGDYATRDIPLVAPAEAPRDGAVGMDAPEPAAGTASVAEPAGDAATVATEPLAEDGAAAATNPDAADLTAATPASAAPAATTMFPAPTAGGDYAVHFGSFSTLAAADRVVAQLRGSQLPGYREAATVDGRRIQRVRIGPYATRAEAESARLRAAHVRDDVGARVVALDAVDTATTSSKPATTTASATPKPATSTPAASSTGFAVQVGAFSKPGDATALRDRLRSAGFSAFTESVSTDKGALTRVRVGPVLARAEADQLKQQVKSKLGLDGIVRPHPQRQQQHPHPEHPEPCAASSASSAPPKSRQRCTTA